MTSISFGSKSDGNHGNPVFWLATWAGSMIMSGHVMPPWDCPLSFSSARKKSGSWFIYFVTSGDVFFLPFLNLFLQRKGFSREWFCNTATENIGCKSCSKSKKLTPQRSLFNHYERILSMSFFFLLIRTEKKPYPIFCYHKHDLTLYKPCTYRIFISVVNVAINYHVLLSFAQTAWAKARKRDFCQLFLKFDSKWKQFMALWSLWVWFSFRILRLVS